MAHDFARKIVVFGFDDVLVPGKIISQEGEFQCMREILKNLSQLEKEGRISLHLATGMKKKAFEEKSRTHSLEGFFKAENIHNAEEEYISKRDEIDRQRHLKAVEENPEYTDEYLKVQAVQNMIEKGAKKEEIIFIGHDLMHDAYYLYKYCGVDTALLKKSLSFANKKTGPIGGGLIYAECEWNDIKKILLGKSRAKKYLGLENMVFSMLKKETIGNQMNKIPVKWGAKK